MLYVTSPVIGDGSDADPFRPKVSIYGDHQSIIPPDSTWALSAYYGDPDLITGDAEIEVLIARGGADGGSDPVLAAGQQLDPAFEISWITLESG